MKLQIPNKTIANSLYAQLTNIDLRLQSKSYSEESIESELDLLAEKIEDHDAENWALDIAEKFYNLNAFYFGLKHRNTTCALLTYAYTHISQKSIDKAICLYKDCYQRFVAEYGKYSWQSIDVLELLVDIYEKNKLHDEFEASLLSLYFCYKKIHLDEHPKTKETKAALVLQLGGWTSLTGLDQVKLDVIKRAESIAIQLPESQQLNAFKSEIYTYLKNAFKEIQKHPQATENLNEMMKQFMENSEASYDEVNVYLVSHEEHSPKIYTTAVFTIKDRIYFCEYTVNNDENRDYFHPKTELIVGRVSENGCVKPLIIYTTGLPPNIYTEYEFS